MKKILLFTGAGFCVPLKLPVATGFTDSINNIHGDLKLYIDKFLGDGKYDIEKVLELLDSFTKKDDFDHLIINERYSNGNSINTVKDYNNLKKYARDAVIKIKRAIYTTLNNFEIIDAENLYRFLLHEVKETFQDCSISFFTTNYDLTFEKAINYKDFLGGDFGIFDVNFGFSTKYGTTTFDKSKIYNWDTNSMEYQKLHGSLDWVKDHFGKCTKSGSSLIPAKPNDTPILYPGYKGVPVEDPFISIHDNFLRKANDADIIICIGFAFRDPYINNLFDSAMRYNKNLLVYCFNPSDEDKLPSESKINHFIKHTSNFKYIKRGIEINENPLKLKELLKI